MSFAYVYSLATASTSGGSQSDGADYYVADELPLTVTKIVDRATYDNPTPLYYNGEQIIFTITLSRANGFPGTINQITLTDLFPTVVLYTEDDVDIDGSNGKVTKGDHNSLTIENLVVNDGHDPVTITITGTIVYS